MIRERSAWSHTADIDIILHSSSVYQHKKKMRLSVDVTLSKCHVSSALQFVYAWVAGDGDEKGSCSWGFLLFIYSFVGYTLLFFLYYGVLYISASFENMDCFFYFTCWLFFSFTWNWTGIFNSITIICYSLLQKISFSSASSISLHAPAMVLIRALTAPGSERSYPVRILGCHSFIGVVRVF